jgi:hypothetical protein
VYKPAGLLSIILPIGIKLINALTIHLNVVECSFQKSSINGRSLELIPKALKENKKIV